MGCEAINEPTVPRTWLFKCWMHQYLRPRYHHLQNPAMPSSWKYLFLPQESKLDHVIPLLSKTTQKKLQTPEQNLEAVA